MRREHGRPHAPPQAPPARTTHTHRRTHHLTHHRMPTARHLPRRRHCSPAVDGRVWIEDERYIRYIRYMPAVDGRVWIEDERFGGATQR